MTLKQIEYFQMVCEKENISAAASELFVSRSVISRALAELEEEFNTRIFTRSKNGVVLTESGQVLARLFEEFVSCYNSTKDWICQLSEKERSPLVRIGVSPTNVYRLYKLYFETFRKAYPEITLHVTEYGASDAWKLLLDGTVDAFITPARATDHSMFDTIELYQTQIVLTARLDDPIVKKSSVDIYDILDLPLAYLNAPMPLEEILISCFRAFGKKPNVVLRTSDKLLLKELTEKGSVYSILPGDMIESWDGIKGIPLDFYMLSTHRLAWGRALPHGAAFHTFIDFMSKYELK